MGFQHPGSSWILMDPQNWQNRDYTADERAWTFFMGVPRHILGGLSCFEVCAHLYDGLKYVFERNLPGDLVNLGVYQGWSLYYIALIRDHFGQQNRKIWAFDTFTGFQEPAKSFDMFLEGMSRFNAELPEAHRDTSLELAEKNLEGFGNIEFVKGDIAHTIGVLGEAQVALSLFDMDDYTPTSLALEPVFERLSPGGVIHHDHHSYHTLSNYLTWGHRQAMREFLEKHPMFNLTGTNLFLKI